VPLAASNVLPVAGGFEPASVPGGGLLVAASLLGTTVAPSNARKGVGWGDSPQAAIKPQHTELMTEKDK
jgi:hypothetical protein